MWRSRALVWLSSKPGFKMKENCIVSWPANNEVDTELLNLA